jgi:tetratricopeptide (TPR) repeat protein
MSTTDAHLAALAKASRRNALLTLSSVLLVVFSLVWSAFRLYSTESELASKSQELRLTEQRLVELEQSVRIQADSLERLKKQMADVLSATVALRAGVDRAFIRDFQQAIQYYDAALAMQPNNPVLYMHRGYTQLRRGLTTSDPQVIQAAVSALEKSVQLDSSYVLGHYNLALAYWAVGDTARAVAEVGRVMALAPDMRRTLLGDPQFYRMQRAPGFWNVVGR